MKRRVAVTLFAIAIILCGCGQAVGDETVANIEETIAETEPVDLHEYDFTLCFAGDISLDEAAVTTAQLDASENGIYGCISPELIQIMKDADLMCLNNEFTYSNNARRRKICSPICFSRL